jgi:predicted nucleic acid-binding protein
MIIVSDTTALSNLIQLNKLELLKKIFSEIIIPEMVYEELKQTFDMDEIARQNNWIQIRSNFKIPEQLKSFQNLDKGELEAISLAIELNADKIIIDEMYGRIVAQKLGFEIIGTVGVLLKAKENSLIDSLKIELDKLIEIGFWMSEELYSNALIRANEK